LRDRNAQAHARFSTTRDPNEALRERQRCVAMLLQGVDIPAEALKHLPSAEEMKRRAAEALAKAQAAAQARKDKAGER
jgi:hypothetical protein